MDAGKVAIIIGGTAVVVGGGIFAWSKFMQPKPVATTQPVQPPYYLQQNPGSATGSVGSSGGGGSSGGFDLPIIGHVDQNTVKTVENLAQTGAEIIGGLGKLLGGLGGGGGGAASSDVPYYLQAA